MAVPLIVGANGQLATALAPLLDNATILDRAACDLSQPDRIYAIISTHQPSVIFNAAAYTAVDKAEDEQELAHTINAKAVGVLARYAFDHHIPFIHYSTDYVFSGQGDTAWKESDPTAPINAYGHSKLVGEQAIMDEASHHQNACWYVFRTSWLYDAFGHNFVNTMLSLAAKREALSIVSDQYGAPTYAEDLAYYSVDAWQKGVAMDVFPSGLYHLANAGETNWHDFAQAIFAEAQSHELAIKTVTPVPSSAYPTSAKRPHNSRLCLSKIEQTFGVIIPPWQDALHRCLQKKFSSDADQK